MASTTMYTSPRFSDDNLEIPLPDCMYQMKNIQNPQIVAMEERTEEHNQHPEITKLLERQVKILEDLEEIRMQADSLQRKIEIKKQDMNKNGNDIRKDTHQPRAASMQDEDLDIVITAKPSNPPMSAIILFNYFRQQGIILSSACHKHSNLKEPVPYDIMKSIEWQDSIVQLHQKLNVTFIWKEDPFGPSVIVNPRVHTPIKGDCNIARFLCRKFEPKLYELLSENGILVADFLIDLATSKIISDNVEETKKALMQVDQQLGKNTWLVDDKFTIADVVVFSAIRIKKSVGLFSHNLKRWFNAIEAKFC